MACRSIVDSHAPRTRKGPCYQPQSRAANRFPQQLDDPWRDEASKVLVPRVSYSDTSHAVSHYISTFCDEYNPNSNYAGVIKYHTYGRFMWKQRAGQGVAGGHRGRAVYVLILCTDNWPDEALQDAGRGIVHDYLYRQYFNMEYSRGTTCCGGFSVQHGRTHYSSVWLNCQSGNEKGLEWQSDVNKHFSTHEESLVDIAIAEWKRRGRAAVVGVPNWLDSQLM